MEFPEIRTETIYIKGILVIRDASYEVAKVSSLIGPQASGKSVAAKCLFFFRSYISDLFHKGIDEEFTRPAFNSEKLKELENLFPNAFEGSAPFEMRWVSGSMTISVSRASRKKKPIIRISDELGSLFRRFRNDYLKFLKSTDGDDVDRYPFGRDMWDYRQLSEDRRRFVDSIPRVLFVPASRAFFSFIQSEVFTLLSAQQSLDKIMIEFGRFYNLARARHDKERYRGRNIKLPRQDGLREILCGEFVRQGKKDIIQTSWGTVPLPSSSSGQQESLPLLLALMHWPLRAYKNDILIIEEPEAHLFPRAQKRILEEIVETSVKANCKVLFTTHSPYILSCLNNEITKLDWSKDEVSSYYIEGGVMESIFDLESSLIDVSRLDSVSEEITRDYFEAISDE